MTMSYNVVFNILIICYLGVIITPVFSGPLDAAFSWARADNLPIEVNLPWLPCKCLYCIYYMYILLLNIKSYNNFRSTLYT